MVELNHRDRTIKVKLVYYGPPLCGKTTNLQVLHQSAAAQRRGEMISVNSAQDRTILFDLLPLKTPGFRGFDLRLQILAVPGQPMYAATRRLVLKGADSLVFVANSALDRWEENLQSIREMTRNLMTHHLDPEEMPLVFQYNKRDLPQVLETEALDRGLNRRHTDAIPAVAIRGEGVVETFITALALTVQDLATRYAILDVKEGLPARQWAEETARDLFGTTSLSFDPDEPRTGPPAPSPIPKELRKKARAAATAEEARAETPPAAAPAKKDDRSPRKTAPYTVVRITPQPPAEAGERPPGPTADARAGELVETYAETSAQLGEALAEMREDRDLALRRLEDVRQSMEAAQQVLLGTPLDTALDPVLSRMAGIAGAGHAAFWVPDPGAPPRAAALRGLSVDPVLGSSQAVRYVLENAGRESLPSFVFAKDNPHLAERLAGASPSFAAVLGVPFRTPGGLQGLGAFYYATDTARPGATALKHLAEIPRALSAALELIATLQTVKAAERALELALAGSASLKGLEDVVRAIEELRDRLGEIRRKPDVPPWFVQHFTELAPALGSALNDGRSLLAFSRGEIQCDNVYVEDLLAELHTPDMTSELDANAETVNADATLLRVALRAMADELRARAGGNTAALAIRTRAEAGRVHVSLRLQDPPEGGATGVVSAGLGLGLARRIAELHRGALDDSTVELTLAIPGS
jgi:signal recognition particle receptor subunit beta/GAF domain-containing protein